MAVYEIWYSTGNSFRVIGAVNGANDRAEALDAFAKANNLKLKKRSPRDAKACTAEITGRTGQIGVSKTTMQSMNVHAGPIKMVGSPNRERPVMTATQGSFPFPISSLPASQTGMLPFPVIDMETVETPRTTEEIVAEMAAAPRCDKCGSSMRRQTDGWECRRCGRIQKDDGSVPDAGMLDLDDDEEDGLECLLREAREEGENAEIIKQLDKIKALEAEIAALKAQRHRIVVDCGPSGMIDDFWADLDVELVVLQYHIPVGLEPSDGFISLDGNDVVVEVRDAEYWKLMPAPDHVFDLVDAGLTFPPEDEG